MSVKSLLLSFLGVSKSISSSDYGAGFDYVADISGVNFFLDKKYYDSVLKGSGLPLETMQLVVFRMLEEQDLATAFPNGFMISSEVVAGLDDEQADILGIHRRYPGQFTSAISGHTGKSSFKVNLSAFYNEKNEPFRRKGPFIYFGTKKIYRLTSSELMGITAVENHQSLPVEERGTTANLRMMALLQMAERSGMRIDLSHFDRLDVSIPNEVGVLVTRMPDGSLELCPSLGTGITPDHLENRWQQLDLSGSDGVLRINNKIVLIEPKRMDALREVMSNRRIPADKVEDFITSPSAFLDASLVNLDLGFSLRVLGAGKLRHMDFGGLDDKKRDWFTTRMASEPIERLKFLIKSNDDVDEFVKQLKVAKSQGADSMEFAGELIDISDDDRIDVVVKEMIHQISNKVDQIKPDSYLPNDNNSKEKVSIVLREADEISSSLILKSNQLNEVNKPDWESYARAPYPHQKEGIDWILSLLESALTDDHDDLYRLQGALLADDMGLGKTYMTLVALREYLNRQKRYGKPEKPMLVIAPLSLLENWEQEVQNTFSTIPFRDIVVLQSGRDLKKYRIQGSDRESVQLASALNAEGQLSNDAIRYALQVGPESGVNRLDMDRRLVLTTYQTLRDYQFSLCVIDWGIVIFDEAQNIKNPNTLQTRAAKGLKADFKLLATGTPVENSLADFWCLIDTAQPGLLGSWAHFRDTWVKPITEADDENRDHIRATVGTELREAVGRFMLRRVKEDQLKGLPGKFIYSGICQSAGSLISVKDDLAKMMSGQQLQVYDSVLEEYRVKSSTEDMRGQALTTLQKLRSISLHPRLHDTASLLLASSPKHAVALINESGKLKVLLDVLEQIKAKREKVILFMVTKQLQRLLKMWLDKIYGLNIHVINGDTAAVQKKADDLTRKSMIEQFESVTGFNIIIMSPIAAGVGLTVVGANHVVHLERHWNPAKEAQATDRVYRIGQTIDVHIYLPAVLHPEFDSFDVHLDRLLNGKIVLKDAVITPDIVSETDMIKSMGL
ncbi:DEAD/DEAH box helicase [Neptunomonas qingdaonensis]|uniref:Superfamily II DNA or RNA helicase, SNF2 family n=1 Tax=Neptunomonas qingdaonensis TaxID=1045558 RepID=A0A1I2TUA2_9GAMM|nr:DEAD/DEAH box helicase [Neptunomonas qingdaonensis]SFG68492.1 Superfamily II DNA or RNA helicase, SNF2 family [Neptunomonas qingdaonensis]